MTENPSRRDSNTEDPKSEKSNPSPLSEKEIEENRKFIKKIKAKEKGKKRREIFHLPHHRVHEKSLKHIFGTSDWFFIILESLALFIIALVICVICSHIYFDMGIPFPLRQIYYIETSVLSVIGIVGILHYFFPEWYVD